MEAGRQHLLLTCGLMLLVLLPSIGVAEEVTEEGDIGLIRDIERREVQLADIDTENFEIGISGGLLSVEDFETNPMLVGSLVYHVTEDFFVRARYGASEAGTTSYERLSGGASLLADRDITFYDLSIGANLFPGEAFVWDKWAVNSSFYLIGGVGAIDFAGNQELVINAGVGYRMIANDWISLNFNVSDHVFETEITGARKVTHNFEISAGLSFFF